MINLQVFCLRSDMEQRAVRPDLRRFFVEIYGNGNTQARRNWIEIQKHNPWKCLALNARIWLFEENTHRLLRKVLWLSEELVPVHSQGFSSLLREKLKSF